MLLAVMCSCSSEDPGPKFDCAQLKRDRGLAEDRYEVTYKAYASAVAIGAVPSTIEKRKAELEAARLEMNAAIKLHSQNCN